MQNCLRYLKLHAEVLTENAEDGDNWKLNSDETNEFIDIRLTTIKNPNRIT